MEAGTAVSQNERDIITVENATVGYGDKVTLQDLSLTVAEGEILTILGPSGCGKTTLLKAIIGLISVMRGRITLVGEEIAPVGDDEALSRVRRRIGVLFQSGALLNSMSIEDNVALPLKQFTKLPKDLIRHMVRLKLGLVKLADYGRLMPHELSGGMSKRAGLARAMSLDPKVLFCDEPTAGLDPPNAREIDGLLLELNRYLGITIVMITHALPTIENISTRCIMLDAAAKGIIASGTPDELKNRSSDERVRSFFHREINDRPTGK